MLFLLIQLSLILFIEKVFASYESPCTTTCDLPGLVCLNGRCYCDWNQKLFWTGARCLACPAGWTLAGKKCAYYFQNKLTWAQASATCQQHQADLISFYDSSAFSLVYQVTNANNGRKKRLDISESTIMGWTSAQAIEFDDLGLYRWSDKSLPTFNSKSIWWCKMNTPGFIPNYPVNEPTRTFYHNVGEACTIFHRATSSTAGLCLDDIYCDFTYPFICERSESTAQKYLGSPPSTGSTGGGDSHHNTGGGGDPHHNTDGGGGGGSTENTDSNAQNNHQEAPLPHADSKTKKKSNIIIIALIAFALLLLAGILIGVFFFIKRRKATRTEHQVSARENEKNQQPTKTDTNLTDVDDVNELASQTRNSDEAGLTLNTDINRENLGFNIGNQKQMKNKRGGYSKQQFENEFE